MAFSRYGQGKVRNAALREALNQRWPELKFSVRNGQGTHSSVTWTDGPTESDVRRVLNQVLAPDGYPWGASTYRSCTDEVFAVAYWRARQAGERDFYREVDETTGATLPEGSTPLRPPVSMSCNCAEQRLDATTITAAERTAAAAVLVVAGPLHPGHERRGQAVARTVALYGDAIDGILT